VLFVVFFAKPPRLENGFNRSSGLPHFPFVYLPPLMPLFRSSRSFLAVESSAVFSMDHLILGSWVFPPFAPGAWKTDIRIFTYLAFGVVMNLPLILS